MKRYSLSVALLFIFLIPFCAQAQGDSVLRKQIQQIAKPVKGIVGVSILGVESRDTLNFNGPARLVLHSVMKFPIALTVLHLVDTGKLSLNTMLRFNKRELLPNNHNPLSGPVYDKYPKGGELSVGDLLSYMVSQSDNTACDVLLKALGGPQTVQKYMLQLGVKGIAIRASEADMASAWELQYTNWCKPFEMTRLLDLFYQGKILSKSSTDFLYKVMTETTTGPNRLKALLPAGTVIAHKTGTSPTNDEGLSPATNDVGIITLPNGKHLIISVFVCNSTSDEKTREATIAQIGKAAWDFYSK